MRRSWRACARRNCQPCGRRIWLRCRWNSVAAWARPDQRFTHDFPALDAALLTSLRHLVTPEETTPPNPPPIPSILADDTRRLDEQHVLGWLALSGAALPDPGRVRACHVESGAIGTVRRLLRLGRAEQDGALMSACVCRATGGGSDTAHRVSARRLLAACPDAESTRRSAALAGDAGQWCGTGLAAVGTDPGYAAAGAGSAGGQPGSWAPQGLV